MRLPRPRNARILMPTIHPAPSRLTPAARGAAGIALACTLALAACADLAGSDREPGTEFEFEKVEGTATGGWLQDVWGSGSTLVAVGTQGRMIRSTSTGADWSVVFTG